MENLLINGKVYMQYLWDLEEEFGKEVIIHSQELFGEEAIYIDIKKIAGYQTAPTSAITHYAEVSKIERYKDTDKFIVYFKDQANEIGPLKLIPKPKGKVKAPQAPRYTTFDKLKNAKNLDEVFQ